MYMHDKKVTYCDKYVSSWKCIFFVVFARRHTLLGCETKAMIIKSMEIKANGDQSSDTTCRIECMSRGGGLLDYLTK